MARSTSNLDSRLSTLVTEHVNRLVATITQAVRENLANELKTYVAGGNGTLKLRPRKANRDLTCIAPGCKNKSKGPRFHYLCEKHVGANRRTYEAWRRQRMKERASAQSAA